MKVTKDWLIGFVDGEGCFYIGIYKNPSLSLGYQVLPEFSIIQHEKEVKLLQSIKKYLNCGVVRYNKKKEDKIMMLRVRNYNSLLNEIVPFFEKNRLLTNKYHDFLCFKKVILLMKDKKHLTAEGLNEILDIKSKMNIKQRNLDKDRVPS